jgi:Tol biopolymer transport system component
LHRLTEPFDANALGVNDLAPEWSPDGTHLLFIREKSFQPPLTCYYCGPITNYLLEVVAATGGRPVRLSPGGVDCFNAAWSPSGGEIAFSTGLAVDIVPANGGKPRQIDAGLSIDVATWQSVRRGP